MRLGITWRGVVRSVGRGLERSGSVRYGLDGRGMAVLVRRGAVRYRVVGSGRARHGGQGRAGHVRVCHSKVRLGKASVRQGGCGNVRQGTAWLATLGGHGRARSDRG